MSTLQEKLQGLLRSKEETERLIKEEQKKIAEIENLKLAIKQLEQNKIDTDIRDNQILDSVDRAFLSKVRESFGEINAETVLYVIAGLFGHNQGINNQTFIDDFQAIARATGKSANPIIKDIELVKAKLAQAEGKNVKDASFTK